MKITIEDTTENQYSKKVIIITHAVTIGEVIQDVACALMGYGFSPENVREYIEEE